MRKMEMRQILQKLSPLCRNSCSLFQNNVKCWASVLSRERSSLCQMSSFGYHVSGCSCNVFFSHPRSTSVQEQQQRGMHKCNVNLLKTRGGVDNLQKRFLFGWLNSIFNRVDESRIKEVGPDRACAEWLLRCGAGVKWDKNPNEWLRDYNSLPAGSFRTLHIVEIDATDSAVMHIGFPHFKGLKHVKKAIFHKCQYMEDEAVRSIGYLKDTLEDLQLSSLGNVTDEGILTLVQMKKLKKLQLWDFLEVRNRKRCISVLKEALPSCDIYFPFAREEDRDPESKEKDTR